MHLADKVSACFHSLRQKILAFKDGVHKWNHSQQTGIEGGLRLAHSFNVAEGVCFGEVKFKNLKHVSK